MEGRAFIKRSLLIGYAISVVIPLLSYPEPASLSAPLLGPWSGAAWGHASCSCNLGNMYGLGPLSLLFLIGTGLAAVKITQHPARLIARGVFLLAMAWWYFLSLIGMINMS